MPNLGAPEIIVIAVVIILLFGWKRLPDAARSVGRSMRIFKSEVSEMRDDKSPASNDTVDGETVHRANPSASSTSTSTSSPVQENSPRTDNTSGPSTSV